MKKVDWRIVAMGAVLAAGLQLNTPNIQISTEFFKWWVGKDNAAQARKIEAVQNETEWQKNIKKLEEYGNKTTDAFLENFVEFRMKGYPPDVAARMALREGKKAYQKKTEEITEKQRILLDEMKAFEKREETHRKIKIAKQSAELALIAYLASIATIATKRKFFPAKPKNELIEQRKRKQLEKKLKRMKRKNSMGELRSRFQNRTQRFNARRR